MIAIALIKNCCTDSDASRHIKLRYFWVHHCAEVGDVVVQNCPTEDMPADVLTKPLQGAMIKKLAKELLGN